ncbi:MAG: HD domain-containing phosphohydrolase [Gaiellales bacterium]
MKREATADAGARPRAGSDPEAAAYRDRWQARLRSVRRQLIERRSALYVTVVLGTTLLVLALSFRYSPLPAQPVSLLLTFLILTAVSAATEFVAVPLNEGGMLSVATIPHVATIVLLPPGLAALSIGLAVAIEEVIGRRGVLKTTFNVASFMLTALVAGHVAGLIGNLPALAAPGSTGHLLIFPLIAVAGGGYYLVNALLLAGVLATVTGDSFWHLFRGNTRDTGLTELAAATLGGLFGLLWIVEPIWTPFLALPGAVISRSLHHIRQLQSQTLRAVKSMAQIVDHRDSSTFHHSERVATYAMALATELDLPEETVDLIEQAASVHDLGKIGIPDQILLKPSALTPDELSLMWRHTEIGADILSNYELFRRGADIVRHHHESYDGSGYPGGLAGERIPIGARVVAVADAFDAMTSNRPYRAALPLDEAVARLRAGAGLQWDPIAVGAFLLLVVEGRLPNLPELTKASTREPITAVPPGAPRPHLVEAERDELRDLDHPAPVRRRRAG